MSLEYLIKISADGKQAKAEANKVVGSLGKIEEAGDKLINIFKGFAGAIGAAKIAEELKRLTDEAIDAAVSIKLLSERADVSAEKLQSWKAALKGTGATIDELVQSLKFMKVRMAEAISNPGSDSAKWFKEFGVSVQDLKSMRPEEVLEKVAAGFAKLPRSAETTAGLVNLFGRGGENLAPAFQKGFAGRAKAAEQAGKVLPESTINQLFEWDEASKSIDAHKRNLWSNFLAKRWMPSWGIFGKDNRWMSISDYARMGYSIGDPEQREKLWQEHADERHSALNKGAALAHALRQRGFSANTAQIIDAYQHPSAGTNKQGLQALENLVRETNTILKNRL